MATFKCEVVTVEVSDHPNADRLEIATVRGYQSVVGKGQFKSGDLAVYIPEFAIIPDWMLDKMNLTGKLAGSKHNRVKIAKLRGIVSQGLLYPVIDNVIEYYDDNAGEFRHYVVQEGDDVSDILGVKKWEPTIPSSMAGDVWNASGKTLSFDIENIKNYPNVLIPGETIEITEKIHGSWMCMGITDDEYIVTSKGISAKGLAFKLDEGINDSNVYVKKFRQMFLSDNDHIVDKVKQRLVSSSLCNTQDNIYILGEIFGPAIQSGFEYGTDSEREFRVFDIYVGTPGMGKYLDHDVLVLICAAIGLNTVPVLYVGPYSKEVIDQYTSGKETVSGKQVHMREGIVINTVPERKDPEIGRVKLKSVSVEYLMRKGKVTEYQ